MKLATWNVRNGNRKAKLGLEYLISNRPDVFALQEAPGSLLEWIRETHPEYNLRYIYDFINRNHSKSGYICIGALSEIVGFGELSYSDTVVSSLGKFFYYLRRSSEQDRSVYIDTTHKSSLIRIHSARFSLVVGQEERRKYMMTVLQNLRKGATNVILGDLNISSGLFPSALTGWFRGYRLREWFTEEKRSFDEVLEGFDFTNPFERKGTLAIPAIRQQPDYIIIPRQMGDVYESVDRGWGSDHRMLFLDVNLKRN